MPDISKPWYTFTCRCGAAWCGLKTSHCSACHETFTSITSFDRHRTGGAGDRKCVAPTAAGLVKTGRDYPCWGIPGAETSPRDRRALAGLKGDV